MTMLFSSATERLIAMTVDSAVARDFRSHQEYTSEQKSYRFPGIGVVTTWGARDGNNVGQYLDTKSLSPAHHTVIDLANLVHEYLTRDYQPRERRLGDVGFHVGGFDSQQRARLFHVFWGCERPNPSRLPPEDTKHDHSPQSSEIPLLYNGRNDLADIVIRKLISEIKTGAALRFDLENPIDQARLGDFVARFAAELTPEVGPPFLTVLILPDNSVDYVRNDTFCPLAVEALEKKLRGH